MLLDRKREERKSIIKCQTLLGLLCRSSSQGCHSVWKRKDGILSYFQLPFPHLLLCSSLNTIRLIDPPSFHPPQFLVWLCHILKMHAARRLSLCPGWRLWLVGGSSPGAKLWVFTLRRCCLYGLSLVTLGLSSTETGLILLRFRPLLLFPLTLKTHTHRVVFTRELVLCY